MARPKKETNSLAPEDSVPRIKLGEVGFTGLKVADGRILDDPQRAFRHPNFLRTVQEMRNESVIASVFNTYRMFLSRVQWDVVAPLGATPKQVERAKFISSLKDDMDRSWSSCISDILEYLAYGFSVQEIVMRRRLKKNGSRYNDGLVGLRSLSPRSQDSIARWVFSEDGRELLGCEQSIANMEHGALFMQAANEHGLIPIPRKKFLLFTADGTKGSPIGTSLLKGVYLAYKQLVMLRDQELVGIAKESAGLPLIRLRPEYMDANAPADKKAVFTACQTLLDTMQAGTNRGIIFPTMVDETTKIDMFDISLLEKKGIQGANLDLVIKRYTDEILSALSVDILKSGSNQGSFSLSDSTTNVLSIAMSHRLGEIADVLNTELIPLMFSMNGWDDEVLPKFVPSDISTMSADELGKLVQRSASVGLITKDLPTVNRLRESMGVAVLPEGTLIDDLIFTMESSSSGEGLKTPYDGTATKPVGKDSSTQNANNAS